MSAPENADDSLLGLNPADLLARGLATQKIATGNPMAWQPPTPEELAALLPQYEIESLLGRGGMGAVYRGKQVALDRAVAIKLLPAELAADAEFLSRFQREARTLAKLQHPGIVAVHDFGQSSAGHLYFVMEFVDGTDLARLIHGPGINPVQALEIVTQICDALQYAHGQGVIHRDIKPANVLINLEGRAKLADFGLARPTDEDTGTLTRSNVVMGTPDYIAPEQMYGHADHRADLYALGVMLYEMLTGQTPRGAWSPPSQRVQVDVRLDQVVVRALQQDPAMRYQQASEIKTDVDVIRTTPLPKAGKGKVKLTPEAPGQRTTPLPKTKKPLNRFALAAIIVLPLLALAWWMMPKTETPTTTQGTPTASSSILWKALPMDSKLAAEAAANEGWVKPFRLYPSGVGKFTDGAVRLKYRWVEGAQLWLDLRSADQSKVELKLNTDGQASLILWQNGEGDTKKSLRLPRLKDGDEGSLELVVVGKTAHAKINDQALILQELPQPWEGILTIGAADSEKAPAIKDVEYAILDGIPDPLKALGWKVPPTPVHQAQTLPWLLVEAKGKNWDLGKLTKKDGWVEMTEGVAWTKPARAFKAIAFRVHYQWKGDGSLSLKRLNNTQPSVSLTLWPKELKLSTRNLTPDLKQADQNTSFTEPLRQGHEGTLELAVIGERMLARLDGQLMFVGDQPGLPPTAFIEANGENVRVRDFQYAILDGFPDPLKALGWEVPQANAVPQNSLWQKASWSDKDLPNVSADGWFSVGDNLRNADPHSVSGRVKTPLKFGDGAVRAQVRFGSTPSKFPSTVGLWLRLPMGQSVSFGISEAELISKRNDGTQSRIVFDTPFRPGDTERIEVAAAGDTFVVRFKGKELRLEYPEARRSGGFTFHGRNFSVKDVEYVILDGNPDPWKALGWEVPEDITKKPAIATPSEAVLKARNDGGKLKAWGKTHKGEFSLGGAVEFDDFVQVAVDPVGWAAMRASLKETWLAAAAHKNPQVSDVPFRTSGRSLARASMVVVLDKPEGYFRDHTYFSNLVSEPMATTLISVKILKLWLGVGGAILAVGPWSKRDHTIKPPDDFFVGAHAFTASEQRFISARKGAKVESWDAATGRKHEFAFSADDVLEMDAAADFVAVLTKAGQVLLFRDDGRPMRSTDALVSKALATGAPFVAVRAGRGMVAAQRSDGSWMAWGESDDLAARVAELGHVIDLDLDYDPKENELLLWIEPVDGNTAAAPASMPPPPAASGSGSPVVDEVVAWVFKNKGDVVISQRGKRVSARSLDQIQPGRFDLTEVHLPGDHVTDVEFARLGSLRGLRKIELTGVSHITSLKPLAGLTELQALWLPGNQGLAEEELAHLAGMTNLGSLRLRLPGATGEGFRHLQRLPKLQLLSLHDAEFTEEGAKAIAGIAELDWLLLNGCVHEENQKSLAAIARMPKLTSLDIDGTLTAEGFAALAPLKLTKLNLSSCKLDNAGFPLLTGSRGTLTELVMAWGATVSDEGIRHIVANFPNIERISASTGSTCTGASIRELARLPNLKRISWWVKGMKTADYVLLADLPMIEGIGVGFGTDITDEALPAFAKCQHLKELHLAETAITDAGLKALQNIRPLKTVNLEKTKITPAGLAEFQKARPDVHVTHNIDAAPAGAALPSK